MGFRNGDRILLFDDYEPDDFWMLQADLVRRTAKRATVLRGQDTLNIYIDQNMIGEVLKSPGMFDLAYPFIVTDLSETSPNRNLDIRSGDRIIGIDSSRVEYIQDARPILRESAGREISVMMLRDSDTLCMNMQVDSTGALGVFLQTPEITRREFTFLESIPGGCVKAWDTIGGYLKDLKLVFTPSTEAYKSVGSFIAIGQIFPSSWNWYSFFNIIALLSIMLGVMNLLPIPALDGGHMVFTIYEMITGRKPSDKFLYITQIIGMILVFGLMFLAFGNDIARLIK